MSYTIIPDLPAGGVENGYQVKALTDLLVLEQDITRKITPLSFVANTIPQLTTTTDIQAGHKIPISSGLTQNLTVQNLMNYINTHLNVIDEVFFVSAINGVDATDFEERGRNEQLPFRTIKFAAQQISNLIATDPNYNQNTPNFVPDSTVETSQQVSSKIRKQYTIMVRSGDYVEVNPVYLPPNTSLIGDNLRRTTIRPANRRLDLFWVDSANYIWGFTFRDHKAPAAAVAFPISTNVYSYATDGILSQYAPDDYIPVNGGQNWVQESYNFAYNYLLANSEPAINNIVVPQQRPFIYCSPYIQGCTSYAISDRMPNNQVGDNTNNPLYPTTWVLDDVDSTPCGPGSTYANSVGLGATGVPPPNNAGCGMRIDGSLVTGYFRSMVLDSFTQVNQGGKGIYILNHGYAQLVSIFTVATHQGIVCEAGGTCSVSTSNSTFGLSGLVATGMSYTPVLTGQFVIPNTTHSYPMSSATTSNGNTQGVYGYSTGSNLFTINDLTPIGVTYPHDEVLDVRVFQSGTPMYVASNPYATLCFMVGDDKPWVVNQHEVETLGVPPIYSGPGFLLEDQVNLTVTRTIGDFEPTSPLKDNPMHQVKLFFIEQGAPTPSLSGGSTYNDGVYDIYNKYNLSSPLDSARFPNQHLPWDINLSFNLALDLTLYKPNKAYDVDGNPLHYIINYKGFPEPINYKYLDLGGTLQEIPNDSSAQSAYEDYLKTNNENNQPVIDFTNAPVKFYARSVVETGSHTFEYMGVGTRMKYAIPAFGGLTNNKNEAIADGFNDKYNNAPGTVFFTSSNELGNFKVGTDFTIVQSTGTIQGDTFSRAILTLVTPLTIVLE
jgi:hypothetical protein